MSARATESLPSAYDVLNVGIALYDLETDTIADTNERFETLFGFTTGELREMSVDEYTANTYPFTETDFVEHLQATGEGENRQFTWRAKRADGELIWVRVNLSPSANGERYALAEVRDITDYYTASRREALFWRIFRHNLRNETNVITAWANRIAGTTENEEIATAADTIRSTALTLTEITESVKQIEQATARTEAYRRHRHATDAVREVIEEVQTDYPPADITVRQREPMWIHVDSAFTHALGHAVENALVHSERDSPVVEITIGPSQNTGRVEIRIADSNPHIPDMELDSLDEFAELTSTSHGSGVGLFVMKWCIESLGGELTVERAGQSGNTVCFYLPSKCPPDDTP